VRQVHGDPVVLAEREARDVEEVVPAVVADAEPAIVGFHDVVRIVWVHPYEAVVTVGAVSAWLRERLAGVV